jgi:hypothetical protein
MSNNVLQLAKGQMYKISFTMMSLYKGENRKLCTPLLQTQGGSTTLSLEKRKQC